MSRPASLPASARTRSWPPMPTLPAGSPPNATSGSSPPTASTPDLRRSLRALTPPTCSPSTARQRSPTCWTRRDHSVNGSSRNGSPACHPNRPGTRRRGSSPPAPRQVGTKAAGPLAPASTFPCLRFGRPCSPMSRNGTATLGGPPPIPCTASTTSRDGWPKRLRSDRSSGGRAWPALAQLMQRIDDQGHDVAGIARAVTRTPLNDLPAQDLRYRLVAHLDLGHYLQRPPVHTSTAKTAARPRPHREAVASIPATTR